MAIPWIDEANGLISREIFVDDGIHQIEIDKIFSKVWLFLGHETEIPNPGDFVTRTLAREPVIVVRRDDGRIEALLNSCRHRGVKLCRVESGNAKGFVCPYHRWTYDQGGKLIATTTNALFPEDMKFSEWGLIPVPKVASYKGLVFGTWNEAAESLEDYLGDFRWYLDLLFARTPGRSQVLAPPQRSIVAADWKIAAINFGIDNTHVYSTHIGPLTLTKNAVPRAEITEAAQKAVQVSTSNGHGLGMICSPGAPFRTYPPELHGLYRQTLSPPQQGVLEGLITTIGTVFPNLSFIENSPREAGPGQYPRPVVLRLWQPLAAGKIEVLSWTLAEAESSPAHKSASLAVGITDFGIAGLFEQDDVTLWSSIGDSSRGRVARAHPFNFKTALPNLEQPVDDHPGPGKAFRPFASEIIQFKFLQHWHKLMTAES